MVMTDEMRTTWAAAGVQGEGVNKGADSTSVASILGFRKKTDNRETPAGRSRRGTGYNSFIVSIAG